MSNVKNGKFVYKNADSMKKMHEFYDKTLVSLDVPYSEERLDTSFGQTHCLLVGDPASRVFCKAREIFAGPVTTVEIDSKHLPSEETMIDVCKRTKEFFKNA